MEIEEAKRTLVSIYLRVRVGDLSYDKAIDQGQEAASVINARGAELAKRRGKKWKNRSVVDLMRAVRL